MAKKELVRVVGQIGQDNLIAHIEPPTRTFGVRLDAGEGTLPRGTVLARASNGNFTVYSGAKGTEPSAVLCDDVELDAEEPTTTAAYRKGCFNRAALAVAEGYTLTAADIDSLRKHEIILSDAL